MAAEAITPKVFTMQGLVPRLIRVLKVTQADWINIPDVRGVLLPSGPGITSSANATANAVDTFAYGNIVINNGSTPYTATTTSLAVDGALAHATNTRLVPYYLKTGSGEVMEVIADSTPEQATSVLTVRRGCLGTTASATGLANNDNMTIMNQIVLAGAVVGNTTMLVFEMPEDPGSRPFA